MPDVMVNVMRSEWSVHFVGPDGQTRVGPWLLFNNHDEIKTQILLWAKVSAAELEQHKVDLRRWRFSSVHLQLTDGQFKALIRRGIGWPWNGYELVKMKEAGQYPPQRLNGSDYGRR